MNYTTKIRVYDKVGFVIGVGTNLKITDNFVELYDNDITYRDEIKCVDRIEILLIDANSNVITSQILPFYSFLSHTA